MDDWTQKMDVLIWFEKRLVQSIDLFYAKWPQPPSLKDRLKHCIIISHRGEHNNKDIFENPSHPYTKNLLKSVNYKSTNKKQHKNNSCPFVYCDFFNKKCKSNIDLIKLSDTHFVRCNLYS